MCYKVRSTSDPVKLNDLVQRSPIISNEIMSFKPLEENIKVKEYILE